jgi:cell division protein ZapA
MSDPPVVHVHIFGSEYRIASQADPDQTREVARYVDRTMREIASSLSLRSVAKIAVLTAVNLADELMKEKQAGARLGRQAAVEADRLARTTNGLD